MSIEPQSIELEELTARHAPLLFDGLNDAALYTYLDEEPPVSLEALAGRYRALERRTSPDGRVSWLNWAIRLRTTGAYIGYVQATVDRAGTANIAYVVFKELWSRGYGREAVALMLNVLKRRYGVQTATAQVDKRNARSIALLKSLRFRRRDCGQAIGNDSTFELSLPPAPEPHV